jgi:carbonic anhydrase
MKTIRCTFITPTHCVDGTTQAWHSLTWRQLAWPCCLSLALAASALPTSHAAQPEHGTASAPAAHTATPAASKASSAKKPVEDASTPDTTDIGADIKKALKDKLIDKKNMVLLIKDKPENTPPKATKPATSAKSATHAAAQSAHAAPEVVEQVPAVAPRAAVAHVPPVVNPRASRDYIRAKAATMTGHEVPQDAAEPHASTAHDGEVHWAYDGENGPQAWGKLKPEFNVCALGKRQSPINIEDSGTLHGPAEPLAFHYTPSSGSVVNNGHTIQVDLLGDNTLTVRGTVYKLVQFHFHTPSEEQVNFRNFAMVVHLVHKSNDGQLAVVAVLLDPGVANALITKVWTYMPLDINDRVRMPPDIIDLNELLPKDQRYYQFIGSLTTPPCTEGVLWMVLKQPTQISKEQLRLFQQLYPNNARPVQPVNGRPVRNAQ